MMPWFRSCRKRFSIWERCSTSEIRGEKKTCRGSYTTSSRRMKSSRATFQKLRNSCLRTRSWNLRSRRWGVAHRKDLGLEKSLGWGQSSVQKTPLSCSGRVRALFQEGQMLLRNVLFAIQVLLVPIILQMGVRLRCLLIGREDTTTIW